jgi:26S proteasome regulatory subunit, ATPase 3, interacting protein
VLCLPAGLRSGAKLVSAEERRAAELALRSTLDVWRKRRSVFRGIWDTISEGLEGKQSDLFEEMGVDTDEAAGLTYAQVEALLAPQRGCARSSSVGGTKRARD